MATTTLPGCISCGDELLCARLRPWTAWPHTQIILRADSGFCREELMGCAKSTQWTTLLVSHGINDCVEKSLKRRARPRINQYRSFCAVSSGRRARGPHKLPRTDAEHSFGRDPEAILRVNHVHVVHPGVGVLQVDEAPSERTRENHVHAPAGGDADAVDGDFGRPIAALRIMG